MASSIRPRPRRAFGRYLCRTPLFSCSRRGRPEWARWNLRIWFSQRGGALRFPRTICCDAVSSPPANDWGPRATWLTFRRTYSSWSHERGVPGKVLAQLMGHANVDTTLNVYTQVLDGSVREAVQKVSDQLFTIVHPPDLSGPAAS